MQNARQLAMEFRTHGGRRSGAGRKPVSSRPPVHHVKRPALSPHHPLHITLRVRREIPSLRNRRFVAEVYPHPAQVVLFGRDRIIQYKKGRVAARRVGLAELRNLIRDRMVGSDRPLTSSAALDELLCRDLGAPQGGALKRYEDALDAVVCAFLAFYLWRWGWPRSELIGDLAAGYIVVPTVPLSRDA